MIVTGANTVQLGATFTSNDVNTALDVDRLRPPRPEPPDRRPRLLLADRQRVDDRRPDEQHRVRGLPRAGHEPDQAPAARLQSARRRAATPAPCNNGTDFVTGAAPFTNGDFVTYYAPDPLATFSSIQVGKRFTFSGGDVNGTTASANTIYFTVDSNNNGKLDNGDSIGLNTGDRIFYAASDPLNPIGGLTSGVFYFVIRLDGLDYKLADTKCHATGRSGRLRRERAAPAGAAAEPHRRRTSRRPGSRSCTRSSPPDNAPISGLQDGHGYFVVGCTGAAGSCNNATGFQLSNSLGGGAINIDNRGVGGGPHLFSREGLNLTSTGQGPSGSVGAHELVINIAPVVGDAEARSASATRFRSRRRPATRSSRRPRPAAAAG